MEDKSKTYDNIEDLLHESLPSLDRYIKDGLSFTLLLHPSTKISLDGVEWLCDHDSTIEGVRIKYGYGFITVDGVEFRVLLNDTVRLPYQFLGITDEDRHAYSLYKSMERGELS